MRRYTITFERDEGGWKWMIEFELWGPWEPFEGRHATEDGAMAQALDVIKILLGPRKPHTLKGPIL